MAHDVPLGCAPDEYDDLISGTCSHLPLLSVFNDFTACFNALFCAIREGFTDAWQGGERSPPLMTVQNMVQ
ncbi:hypothetical protein [Enterobacter hormaechei]|uniref:hypothetical protein n=1 Tax=Enterobacter hormaechei TaxID=158836 RepID=UPI0039C0527C